VFGFAAKSGGGQLLGATSRGKPGREVATTKGTVGGRQKAIGAGRGENSEGTRQKRKGDAAGVKKNENTNCRKMGGQERGWLHARPKPGRGGREGEATKKNGVSWWGRINTIKVKGGVVPVEGGRAEKNIGASQEP